MSHPSSNLGLVATDQIPTLDLLTKEQQQAVLDQFAGDRLELRYFGDFEQEWIVLVHRGSLLRRGGYIVDRRSRRAKRPVWVFQRLNRIQATHESWAPEEEWV